ncbi:hypothetical protein ACFL2S_12770 [Thermodesulfobacteriota bacterium]
MPKSGVIGFLFLIAAFFLLCYQFISAALKLGPSNNFIYKNIRLIDVLDKKYFDRIDTIPSIYIQSIAEFLISAPLLFWLIGCAFIFFGIQAFKRVK